MKKLNFLKPNLVNSKLSLSFLLALLSLELYLGIIFGYFLFKFFSGKIPSLAFKIADYKLHFHHWLCCLVILVQGLRYNFLPFPQLSYGFLSGAIFQGIFCYSDWYKIIYKEK